MTVNRAVGEFLDRIDQWPLSLRELARRAGLSSRTVLRMQTRDGSWTVAAVIKVEAALDALREASQWRRMDR